MQDHGPNKVKLTQYLDHGLNKVKLTQYLDHGLKINSTVMTIIGSSLEIFYLIKLKLDNC